LLPRESGQGKQHWHDHPEDSQSWRSAARRNSPRPVEQTGLIDSLCRIASSMVSVTSPAKVSMRLRRGWHLPPVWPVRDNRVQLRISFHTPSLMAKACLSPTAAAAEGALDSYTVWRTAENLVFSREWLLACCARQNRRL